MSVVTKRLSNPVATLAITLLTATLPAQCEKLSTLKPDRVHGWQTVLHTSSGSLRWYQSDEMWRYQQWVRVSTACAWRQHRECTYVSKHYAFHFSGNPPMTQRLGRGLTPNRSPKTPPSWDTTYSQVTGGVFLRRHSVNFSDFVMSFLLPMKCAAWVHCACVCVCIDKQDVMTACRGGFHGREANQTATPQVKLKWWGKFYVHVN